MSKIDQLVENRLAQNIFVWFFLFVLFTLLIQAENKITASLLFIAFSAPAVYINNLKILPLFFKNRIKQGILFFLLNTLLFSFIALLFLSNFLKKFEIKMLLNVFGGVLLVLIFGTALKIAKDSFVKKQQEKEAELKLLKAQLNPHFLFNTLNNLYGLSVVKSDKLPNLMLKLSNLLRYSLYETSSFLVPLEKEITYLENYISLEKIRLEDKTTINFEVSGNFSTQKIAPMLFIVFIENAFKHLGVLNDGKSSVSVKISEENNSILFACENTIDKTDAQNHQLEKGKSGIGLVNAKKRLELLYANHHQLKITKTDELFSVHLKLE